MNTIINIPQDIQDRIIKLCKTKYDINNSTWYSDNILDVLNSDAFNDDFYWGDLLENGDEVTVLEIASDIYIEFIDHYNRDLTINYYSKYEV